MAHNQYEIREDAPFDAFREYDTVKWLKSEVGSSAATFDAIGGVYGGMRVNNPGGGTLGLSMMTGLQRWGRGATVMLDIITTTATPNAAGRVEASLELYLDADNYIKFGPYKDGAGVVNDQAYLRYKRGGGGEVAVALAAAALDATARTYTIGLTNNYVIFYLEGVLLYRLYFPEMANHVFRISAGTAHNDDICDIYFRDYLAYPRFSVLEMATYLHAARGGSVASAQVLEVETQAPQESSVNLSTTAKTALEFTTAIHGTVFDLDMFLNLGAKRIDYCFLDDGGAFTDYTEEASNLDAGDLPLTPAVPVANDAIYFGSDSDFNVLDIVLYSADLDNDWVWEYWTGAAWADMSAAGIGFSDGTNDGARAFEKSGRVYWNIGSLGTVAVDGTTAYWVRARVSVAGVTQPIASHAQVADNSTDTGFDARAVFGSMLEVGINSKIGAGYPIIPLSSYPFVQSQLDENPHITFRCYADTRVELQLSETPGSQVTIPYRYMIRTLRS